VLNPGMSVEGGSSRRQPSFPVLQGTEWGQEEAAYGS
jgi:hypothetical protein